MNKRILVVEDDLIGRKIAKLCFEALGCSIDVVETGEQALKVLTEPHHYDGVYMDIGLPLKNGMDTCKAVRKFEAEHPEVLPVTIIAVTANCSPEEIKFYKESGMQEAIPKPLSKEKAALFLKKLEDYKTH